MSKKQFKLFSILTTFLLLFTLVLPNTVATAAEPFFTESFESGSSNWSILKGTWSVITDGTKVFSQTLLTDEGRAHRGDMTWTNYAVQADMKVTNFNGNTRALLCARFIDGNNYYAASLYNKDGGTLELRKKAGGSSSTITSVALPLSENTWYTVKLEVVDSTIKVYVNGSLKITATDSTFKAGAVGLVTQKNAVRYDNVKVTEPTTSTGNTIKVSSTGTSLETAVTQAKSGDTILVSGTVTSDKVTLPSGVTLAGESGAKINFSKTTGTTGRGITISGSNATVRDLEIYGASDNGIFVSGNNNKFYNLKVRNNKDAGIQVSNGGAYNYFENVYSYANADLTGENADGFAVKLHSGVGNKFVDCKAEFNTDDGWDLYAAHGAVEFLRCQANYNGEYNGIKGDGNGFKLGGVDNKTDGVPAHLDPLEHKLTDCSATGNLKNGFDRNNQNGVVTMINCTGDSNKGKNFNWPLTGTPSALGYQVTFAKAIINGCTSKNGTNTITGATLTGTCTGF